jgi:L,D-transpeptidase YcbB
MLIKYVHVIFPIIFVGFGVFNGLAQAQESLPVVQTLIQTPVPELVKVVAPSQPFGEKLDMEAAINEFYGARTDHPVLAHKFSPQQLKEITDVFAASDKQGLNPVTYHTEVLQKHLTDADITTSLEFDAVLLDAVARYAGDMTGMRVKPENLGLRAKDWRVRMEPLVAFQTLLASSDPAAWLESLTPSSKLYHQLQVELALLRPKIATGNGHDPMYPFPVLEGVLHRGDRHAAIVTLRERLGVEPEDAAKADLYDDPLARMVMEFQQHHGLKDDGIIGPQTVQFFNQTYLERYRQVVANLERLRWLDPAKPTKYIVINIPAATLWAINNDKVVAEMPVIVGRAKRPTAQFKTEVVGVRFNPTWTVPLVIKVEDFLPELRKDPEFLNKKGIVLLQKGDDGKTFEPIDPTSVDWTELQDADMEHFRMVQGAGRSNALGKIRILMPNQYGIYLHDTNTPEYFRDDKRTISSGCVRLSDPQTIARFVMEGTPGWSEEKMVKYLAADDKTVDQIAKPSFPVILLYQTAWLKKDGSLVLAYDLYEEDIKLYNELEAMQLLPPL